MFDAKSYLNQIRLCDIHINEKLDELMHLREMATKITATWKDDIVSGSGSQDRLGDTVAKIVDMQAVINRAVDEYVDIKQEISATVERIQNPDQVAVLYKRYFQYETLEQIACEMNMTYRNVCYIHGRALQAVTELMKEG